MLEESMKRSIDGLESLDRDLLANVQGGLDGNAAFLVGTLAGIVGYLADRRLLRKHAQAAAAEHGKPKIVP